MVKERKTRAKIDSLNSASKSENTKIKKNDKIANVVAYTSVTNVPVLHGEAKLSDYIRTIKKFPMLSAQEEIDLANEYYETQNIEKAHVLVTSHLRLVAKIAYEYKGYGLPISDIISEGNIGLMRAVKKFDPTKGFRLSTYAMWWIKAYINEFILNSWSLVKIGTAATQKKLFFNLKKMKNKLGIFHGGELSQEETKIIATELNVPEKAVMEMDGRIGHGKESSLNSLIGNEKRNEKIEFLASNDKNQEELYGDHEETKLGKFLIKNGFKALNDREQYILSKRKLMEKPMTLEELGTRLSISKERVRQIENRAFEKLQKAILSESHGMGIKSLAAI